MSRQVPIYVYASDEEPTEDTYDSQAASAHGDPSVHDGAISDDGSDVHPAPPAVPMTIPATAPTTATSTRPHFAETSRGRVLRMTPRIVIRDFPRGPLAPRDKAPMADQDIHMDEQSTQRFRPTHLGWMPSILRSWRSLEGIPSTYETGESSHAPSPTSLTGEPLELTVTTLVAVVRTLFGFHYGTRNYLREFQSDASRLDGDVGSIYGRLHATEVSRVVDRVSLDAHGTRLELLETRVRSIGYGVGMLVAMAVLRTAVGLFLPYFY